ncbi:hypothetical protein M9Y10_005380 [Tritrichomonas musculus]|uniref:C2 domain-containing protein n=1 Tax=Tritrichomonas musculus TaxID=1915356 RepID=A0ABR2JKY9_9EUKA
MTDPLGEPNKLLSLRILSGSNLPMGSSESKGLGSLVKIFLVGPIKSYVAQTSRIKSINPEWKTGVMYFNPVRGLRIHFEIWNDTVIPSSDCCVACGDFDPHYNNMQSSGEPTRVDLFRFPLGNFKKKEIQNDYTNFDNSPCYLMIYVKNIVKGFPTQPPPPNPLIHPFYITFDPENAIRLTTPYDQYAYNEGVKGYLPYRFSYELSAAIFNEKSRLYSLISSSNREIPGAWHSGPNICGSYSSLSPCIRIDPSELGKAGYKYVFIIISTNDLTTLKSQIELKNTRPTNADGNLNNPKEKCADANITVWSSQEPNCSYSKGLLHKLDTTQLQDLRPVGQFPLLSSKIASTAIIAIGAIEMPTLSTNSRKSSLGNAFRKGKNISKDNSPNYQISFIPTKYMIPNDTLRITSQNPSEIIPLICKKLQIPVINNNSDNDFEKFITLDIPNAITQFPLFVPRSLTRLFKLKTNPIILAKASACRNHIFAAFAYDNNLKNILNCSQLSPYQLDGAIKFLQGNIIADLSLISKTMEISYIGFAIFGQEMLRADLITNGIESDKIKKQNDPANMLTIYMDQQIEIIKTPYKYSRTKNALLWFFLFRDSFGGWGITNLKRGVFIEGGHEQVSQVMGNIIKEILKIM